MLETEYCVMECGEEELDECQEKFYNSKVHDLDELLKLALKSSHGFQSDDGADSMPVVTSPSKSFSARMNLDELLNQPVVNTPKPKPLVVLDPATLNAQLGTSNGYRVASSSASKNPPVQTSGHSLPALAPNFRPMPQRTVTTSEPSVPPGLISLTDLLNSSAPPPSAQPPRQNPHMMFRFPAPPPQAVHVHQTPIPTPVPEVLRLPQLRVRAPISQVPAPSSQIGVRPPPQYTYSQVQAKTLSSSTNGIVPQPAQRFPPPTRFPEPPKPNSPLAQTTHSVPNTPSSNTNGIVPQPALRIQPPARFPEPPKPNNPLAQTTHSALNSMQKHFNTFAEPTVPSESSGTRTNSTSRSPLPPPDLPLLPETRPETASDSRPRPRPGPASRTHRLPSSPDSLASSDMVDLTQDDQPPSTSKKGPTKEKTFPSLIVTAKASLKIISTVLVNNERILMDNQIRKVMQMPASVFTEYLLQQRLLKSEQLCKEHHKPLKLGIYSDPKRFPVSGGYVWIADCCKSGFCSVYSGSIFDKTLQPPTNIVKLMYHWACNTAVHNVLNWVKVDSYIMKTYYTFFRAICTSVVHQKIGLLGGDHKKVQVGVISIGTYPDGTSKEVKVDIMAVMDPDNNAIRLKVLENFLSDSNKVYESKFRKILEVLKDWVHPKTTIITDFAVDLALCREYGFSNLVVSGGRHSANNNNNAVMDYMKAKIPVMFQNTLGMLSYTIIQQFLDELVWRETWGQYPCRAYDCLVENLAELTKLPGPDLITKLKSIASEPTKDWRYSIWKEEAVPSVESVRVETVPAKVTNRAPSYEANINKKSSVEEIENRPSIKSSVEEIKNRPSIKSSMEEIKNRPSIKSSVEEIGNRPSMEDAKREKASESMDRSINSVDPAVAVPMCMIPQSQHKASDNKIFLEPFYYGVVEGDPTRQKRTGSFLAECVLCKRDFLSASSFTNHLIHHALNGRVSKIPHDLLLNVCQICQRAVQDVDRHKKECHPYPASPEYLCKICRLDLKSEEKIIKHMNFVHQELDMPYKCDLCRFQTSIYDKAVSHFKDSHNKDYCVRCPYCFKNVRFCSKNGLEIAQNQYYFIQHVQKHSVTKLNRKCEKCLLSFTNMATLKQHQEKVHKRSGKFLRNVRRLKLDASKMLIMSAPIQAPLPPVTLNENSFHTLKGKALSSSVVLPEYYAICSCLECDGPMTQNHFSVKMTCTRCSFQSCCANSIREHAARRHLVEDNPKHFLRSQIIGGSASLDKSMYCSYCTFSSSNGNKMAAHLLHCGDGGALATADKRKLEAFVSPCKIQRIL